jgi:hypothetical protein
MSSDSNEEWDADEEEDVLLNVIVNKNLSKHQLNIQSIQQNIVTLKNKDIL